MDNKELLEAMHIYQRKHGGTLVEISILFVNVSAALKEAAQQSMHPTSGYWDASEGEKSPEVLSVTVSDSTNPTCG